MRLIDADAIPYTMLYKENWMGCTGIEKRGVWKDTIDAMPTIEERKKGKWILDEDPHDGDCRCSVCLIAIDQMHERNHGLLNALTGGKWWTFYKFCPNCGADMRGDGHETD